MGERSVGVEDYSLSNYSKATRLLSILALGVASCSPRELQSFEVPRAEPVPATETFVPSPTSTEHSTPTETTTPTESSTPTPEVKNYGICETEDFLECPIPAEDLFNGKFLAFLETLSTPFDPNNMKKVPWVNPSTGDFIYPHPINSPNYVGITTIGAESGADFRRGVTAGHTVFEGRDYLVLPVEFYDPSNPEENVWIITVFPLFIDKQGGDFSTNDAFMERVMRWWRELMKVNPIFKTADYRGSLVAPLASQTFEENSDMAERFDDFVAGQRSALHGKVLMTTITSNPGDEPADIFN